MIKKYNVECQIKCQVNKNIKQEEATNIGSYLKGVKGVDFTSSGVNNYSISVRGFNSSFASKLLTLNDRRIAK